MSWAKAKGLKNEPINARSEDAAGKPFFRSAFKSRRCLVPATGSYEWQARPGGKVPMWIHSADDEILTFAGLWEEWRPENAEPVRSFAILTTSPSEVMRPIHDRMPVLLARESRDAWLDPSTPAAQLQDLMRPYPGPLDADPVSTRVNSPANDGPELIERITGV